MYFLPNAEFLEGARKKENLAAVRFLHVDLDFKDYPGNENQQSDRVLGLLLNEGVRTKGIPQPTAVWFTGGGCQAVWRLEEPLESTKQGLEQGPVAHPARWSRHAQRRQIASAALDR